MSRDQTSWDQISLKYQIFGLRICRDMQGFAEIFRDLQRSAEICRKSLDQTGFGPLRSMSGDQTSGD